MTRADFVKEISTKMNCTRDDAKKMIEAVEEVTLAAIKAEDDVPFSFAKIGGNTFSITANTSSWLAKDISISN